MSLITKIVEQVAQIAPDRERDELSDAHRFIGKPLDRLDGRQKVTGTATFTAEYALDGLAHAALVYSAIAKGTIKSLDAKEAEAAPGVIAVITHKNAPKMKPPQLYDMTGTFASSSTTNVLNTDEIFWNGQPVAFVVADTLDRAEYAASLVKVTYNEQTAVTSFDKGKADAKLPKTILGEEPEVKRGDAEAALAAAKFRVDHTYTTPRHNHNAIELHATTAHWDGKKLTIYDASQNVQGFANTLADMFSLDKEDVRFIAPFVGGGFGGKGTVWSHIQICALAAKVTERPVRLTLSRKGVFRIVGGRTCTEQRVALGTDEQGKLTALIHTGVTAESPGNELPEPFSSGARHLYAAENMHIQQKVMKLNIVANTFMRAPGESPGTFALESAMDELAYELGIDPIELRLRNEPDNDPTKGTKFSSRHVREAFQLGAEKFEWEKRNPQVRATRDGEWLVGQGFAGAFYPFYRMPTAARVRINADGTAVVQTSTHEMGMGTATVQTQIAAERLGLPMEKIRFEYGDTRLPAGGQAGGSSQTVSVALAVQQAFEEAKKELLALVKKDDRSPLAKADKDDVQASNGGLYIKSLPKVGESYAAILTRAGVDCVEGVSQTGMPMEIMKHSMQSYGAQFCEIRVNETTGEARVSRWVGAFDTGRIINPKTVHSQFRGGIIMGIGMALTEETLFDERSGRIANPSLAEYHVPVNADIPKIETYFLDIPDPLTPLGAHGVGEIGITGVAAAVANAVYHATGKRIRNLPITLDKLL